MEYNDEFQQEETIDIKKYLFKILDNWYWFAFSIFIALAVACILNRYSEPVYTVNSSVIVRDDENTRGLSGSDNLVMKNFDIFQSKKNVQNEIGILQSYSLTNLALKELPDFSVSYVSVGHSGMRENNLYKSSPFVVILDTSATNVTDYPVHITILSQKTYKLDLGDKFKEQKEMRFGEAFISKDFHFIVQLRDPAHFVFSDELANKYYFTINDLNALTNEYKSKLTITVNDKKGSLLNLSIQGTNAQQEADYLNKLQEVYIRYGLEEKNQTAISTLQFIDEQLKGIRDSLRFAELALQNFRLNNKVIDIDKEGSAIYDNIDKIQSDKVLIDVKLKYYNYLLKYIKQKKEFKDVIVPSAMGIDDPVLTSMLMHLRELYEQKNVLEFSAKASNPALNLANNEIQNTRSALIESVNNNIKTAAITQKDVDNRIADANAKLERLPVNQRLLINFQRQFNLNDQIYTYLLQKRAETGIAKASNNPDNKILDIARPENAIQVKPKTSLNYMIAFVLGAMIPMIIILLLDFLNNKISSKKDVEKATQIPILGSVGHSTIKSELPVFENPKSSVAESFRSLRTNMQYMIAGSDKHIISVTSTLSGEGKTFGATNLATIIAMSNKKTLLASFDLRKPKIHTIFNLNNTVGISTYLIKQSSYQDIIKGTNINNLFVAPSGPIPPNPSELIETEQMREFIRLAKNDFDYVVFDTPPIAIVTDAILLGRCADLNVFVVRQDYSSKEVLNLANDLYKKQDLRNLALIINDTQTSNHYYGYDYGYSYGYGGEGYYGEEKQSLSVGQKLLKFLRIRN